MTDSQAIIEAARAALERQAQEAAAHSRAVRAPFDHLCDAMGLYPDSVRMRPDVRAATRAAQEAHAALARFNGRFKPLRMSTGQRLAARKAAREAAAGSA